MHEKIKPSRAPRKYPKRKSELQLREYARVTSTLSNSASAMVEYTEVVTEQNSETRDET